MNFAAWLLVQDAVASHLAWVWSVFSAVMPPQTRVCLMIGDQRSRDLGAETPSCVLFRAQGVDLLLTDVTGAKGPGRDTPGRGPGGDEGDGKTGLITKTRPVTKKPSLYKVLLLNDDYTPMEFVILILERFFNKGREDATRVMMHVHQKGVGVCGVYTYEVAETKVAQVMDFAGQNQHPLQCRMEKE
jgi:ATP-dependent Clp protease adaptor protein ClpS